MDIFYDEFSVERREKYKIMEKIGVGSFGDVKLGINIENGQKVALKYVHSNSYECRVPLAVFREIESLRQLRSPNIIKLLDVFPFETNIILVFEFFPSNMAELIENAKSYFSNHTIKYCAFSVLRGLHHIHENNLIHRDIKPSNLLISDMGNVKIADFGLCRIQTTKESMSHQIVTRWYRPPEILFGARHYTAAVDIWSLGAVVAELMCLAPLFPGSNDIDQIYKVFQIMGTPTPLSWPVFKHLSIYLCYVM